MKHRSNILLFIILYICVHGDNVLLAQGEMVNKNAVKSARIINEKQINTANLETSPAFIGDKIGLVYTTTKSKLFDKEINEAFFELSLADVNSDNSLTSPKPLNKKYNSDYHEGPMAYDINLNKLYFTRSLKEKRIVKNVETDTTYLRIMEADFNVTKPDVKPLNIVTGKYSVCHPTLTPDGKTLIFASNMPGGFGGYDLYITYYDGQEWTGIINLGPRINTSSHELFPFLLNNSILIFSSPRANGMGGLDLYVTGLNSGSWTSSELLPAPFNSTYDDLGMIVRENMKSGYFASNRPGGSGKDDIFRFETDIPLFGPEEKKPFNVTAHILDKLSLEAVPNGKFSVTPLEIDINDFAISSYNVDMLSGRNPGDIVLKLTPKKGTKIQNIIAEKDGRVSFLANKGQKYLISAMADGYENLSLIFDYDLFGDDFNIVIEPKSEVVDEPTADTLNIQKNATINIPVEPGKSIVFDQIFYDYNSTTIKSGAAQELDALASAMLSKSDMKIRLESHTDSRGASAYNLQLSISRAEAARTYLINLGVASDRIKIRGWGETRLRNRCTDKVPCKETDHAFNRRTEVFVEY